MWGGNTHTHTPRIGLEEEEAIGKLSQWGLIPNPVNKCEPRVTLENKHNNKSPKASIKQYLRYNSLVGMNLLIILLLTQKLVNVSIINFAI